MPRAGSQGYHFLRQCQMKKSELTISRLSVLQKCLFILEEKKDSSITQSLPYFRKNFSSTVDLKSIYKN